MRRLPFGRGVWAADPYLRMAGIAWAEAQWRSNLGRAAKDIELADYEPWPFRPWSRWLAVRRVRRARRALDALDALRRVAISELEARLELHRAGRRDAHRQAVAREADDAQSG